MPISATAATMPRAAPAEPARASGKLSDAHAMALACELRDAFATMPWRAAIQLVALKLQTLHTEGRIAGTTEANQIALSCIDRFQRAQS